MVAVWYTTHLSILLTICIPLLFRASGNVRSYKPLKKSKLLRAPNDIFKKLTVYRTSVICKLPRWGAPYGRRRIVRCFDLIYRYAVRRCHTPLRSRRKKLKYFIQKPGNYAFLSDTVHQLCDAIWNQWSSVKIYTNVYHSQCKLKQ